jgi:8-oxo-dGTP pyrophosphatase MutT (NUDIX family)/phosphohistidine phosphatase SixA
METAVESATETATEDLDVTEPVRAAGGVVWRPKQGTVEVALVHRPAYDDWSFPKGKLHDGESEAEAALREVEEETGLRCNLGPELGMLSYTDHRGRPKTVRYWEMTVSGGQLAPANEVDDARWVPLEDTRTMLSYEHDRDLLRRFGPTSESEPGAAVPIYLIRHAKATDPATWTENDELRPLTAEGRRQAAGLITLMADAALSALISSPHLRCVQTLEPLSEAWRMPIATSDAIAEGASVRDATELMLSAAAAGPAALCTHGDVMMSVVRDLLDGGVKLRGDQMEFKKASTWVLKSRDGEFTSARYLPPPKPTT